MSSVLTDKGTVQLDGVTTHFLRGDGTFASPGGSGATSWDQIQNAAANLTLANAGFTTTFNQTSAVNWIWANTTAATNVTPQSSPILNVDGTYWNGSASATDAWTMQDVVGSGTNGTSAFTLTHSGNTTGQQSFIVNTTIQVAGALNNLVQSAGTYFNNAGGVASEAQAFGSNVTAGNLLVVIVGWEGTTSVCTLTDTLGNSYTTATGPTTSSTHASQTFYKLNTSGGANTVTAHFSVNATFISVTVAEFSGVNTFGNAAAAAASSVSITPNQFYPLVIQAGDDGANGLVAATGFVTLQAVNRTVSGYALNGVNGQSYTSQAASGTAYTEAHILWFYNTAGQVGQAQNTLVVNNSVMTYQNTATANSGTPQNSPTIQLIGQYWTGSASAADTWGIQEVLTSGANGLSALTFSHTGSTVLSVVMPGYFNLATNGNLPPNNNVGIAYLRGILSPHTAGSNDWKFYVDSQTSNPQLTLSNDNALYFVSTNNAFTGTIDTSISRQSAGTVAIGNGGATFRNGNLQLGKITAYNNGQATVANGIPTEYAQSNLTAQGANVAATTLFAVPIGFAGMYRISVYMIVTRAATSSSTMPDSRIIYTDADNTGTTITISGTASSTGNTLSTVSSAHLIVRAAASTNIQFDIGQVTPYASVGATSMQFAYHAIVEAL